LVAVVAGVEPTYHDCQTWERTSTVTSCSTDTLERIADQIQDRLPPDGAGPDILLPVLGRLASQTLRVPHPHSPPHRFGNLWCNLSSLKPVVRQRVLTATIRQVRQQLPPPEANRSAPVSDAAEPPLAGGSATPAAAPSSPAAAGSVVPPDTAAQNEAADRPAIPRAPDWFDRFLSFVARLLPSRG
jgi:hypothetical protein